MINVDRYIPFLRDNNLNQAQFMLMYCLHFKRYDILAQYKDMFPTEDGSAIGNLSLNDLINRKFIVKTDEGLDADSFQLTDKFTHIFVDKFIVAEEIWNLYPRIITSDGKNYPIKLMDKIKFREAYIIAIEYSVEEHKEVLLDLQYAIDNNLINFKIETFIQSEQWKEFRKERLNLTTDQINEITNNRNDDF